MAFQEAALAVSELEFTKFDTEVMVPKEYSGSKRKC